MCVSLDEPEPVDSVLTFLSGYDILKYLWVKATMVSVHLWILFVTLQNTNNLLDKTSCTKVIPYLAFICELECVYHDEVNC